MAGTLIVPVVDEGLGNSAYLAGLGDGRALAVDAVLPGGPSDWSAATGVALERNA